MKLSHSMVAGFAGGFIGLLLASHSASAQLILREQIVQALTTQLDFGQFSGPGNGHFAGISDVSENFLRFWARPGPFK